MLGVLDIMGVEVQNREQVEVRENVGARETEEEDKTRKQQTLRHVTTCDMFYADTSWNTLSLSHNVMCAQG